MAVHTFDPEADRGARGGLRTGSGGLARLVGAAALLGVVAAGVVTGVQAGPESAPQSAGTLVDRPHHPRWP